MSYVAIVAWDAEGRVTKNQPCRDQASAEAHVARVAARYPSAFAAEMPAGEPQHWLADAGAKTVSLQVPQEVIDRDAREQALAYRAARAEAYRARIGKEPDNTREETIGDVLDALIKAVVTGDMTELQAIAAEVARIKQEIPKP